MNRNLYLSFLLITLTSLYSCRKDVASNPVVNLGYNYFPDEVGRFIIYEVDSIHYDDVGGFPRHISHYQMMDKIVEIFNDNSNRPTLRIERFKKFYNDTIPYANLDWNLVQVLTANKTQTALEVKEGNITFLKLTFPVKEKNQWNGNAYNSLGVKNYKIIGLDKPEIINSLEFDSVATVSHLEKINVIENRSEIEKFSRNVGIIYRQMDSLYFGNFKDTNGYHVVQKIISYGN